MNQIFFSRFITHGATLSTDSLLIKYQAASSRKRSSCSDAREPSGLGPVFNNSDPPLLLDLSPYKHTVPPRDDSADLVAAVRETRDSHKKWTSNSGLNVISTDRLRADRRRIRVDHWYDARHAYEQGGLHAVLEGEVQRLRRWIG